MTDEKKPREFWILDKWLTFPNGPELVCYNEKPHQVYTSKGADIYHVIEKAYADKLLARIEKLQEACASLENAYNAYNDLKYKHGRVLEALMFAESILEKHAESYEDGPGMFIARQFDDRIHEARKALIKIEELKR